MRKKNALIVFILFLFVKAFAGEYVYWEGKKNSPSGRMSAHVRVCSSKDYLDNATANLKLNEILDAFAQDFGQWRNGYEITEVCLKNKYNYRIVFNWDYKASAGKLVISGGVDGKMYDIIYNSGYVKSSYDFIYEVYRGECDKYLSML